MDYLVIFKRFEIWLLLGVVVALLIFAFQPSGEEEIGVVEPEEEEPVVLTEAPTKKAQVEEEEKEEPSLAVDRVTTEETGEGRIVEVTLSARSLSGEEVIADESLLRATTESGNPVPRFFEPFRSDPTVTAEEASLITVRFWLASETDGEPARSLWLEFQGERTQARIPENG